MTTTSIGEPDGLTHREFDLLSGQVRHVIQDEIQDGGK